MDVWKSFGVLGLRIELGRTQQGGNRDDAKDATRGNSEGGSRSEAEPKRSEDRPAGEGGRVNVGGSKAGGATIPLHS